MFDAAFGYFGFTSVVYVVGLALVAAGQHLRARRDRRRTAAELDAIR